MMICHLPDCILEMDSSHANGGMPMMARALAGLADAKKITKRTADGKAYRCFVPGRAGL